MAKFDSPLNDIQIASPCSADWDEMFGDERKRFCSDCGLNVYNLSGMTREDAESLVTNAEGRLCIRFYRRADGTILTNNCPVGWEAIRQRTRLYAAAFASLMITLFGGVLFVSLFFKKQQTATVGVMRQIPPANRQTPMGVMTNRKPEMGESVPTNTNKARSGFEVGKMKVMTPHLIDKAS